MEFTNDELVFMIDTLVFTTWPEGQETMVNELITKFEDKLKEQRS